jgi:hypothetical protein
MSFFAFNRLRRWLQITIPLPAWFPTRGACDRFVEAFAGPFAIACAAIHFVGGIFFLRLFYLYYLQGFLKFPEMLGTFVGIGLATIGMSFFYAFVGYSNIREYREKRRRIKNRFCLKCGYDLRASPDRCPECGAAVAATA